MQHPNLKILVLIFCEKFSFLENLWSWSETVPSKTFLKHERYDSWSHVLLSSVDPRMSKILPAFLILNMMINNMEQFSQIIPFHHHEKINFRQEMWHLSILTFFLVLFDFIRFQHFLFFYWANKKLLDSELPRRWL